MKVLELLNGPEKWCQQAYAKDAEGKAVNPTDEKAVFGWSYWFML